MFDDLAQQAVKAALSSNWTKAIELNLKILKKDSKNIEALNRLSHAYIEKGLVPKATKISNKVLKLDPHNSIAQKRLLKWKGIKKDLTNAKDAKQTLPSIFLEEPGKTKVVDLLYLGDKEILKCLNCAQVVRLNPFAHRVSITTQENAYIGRLPDDLAAKIIRSLKNGFVYQSVIKSASSENVKLFIKEVKIGN